MDPTDKNYEEKVHGDTLWSLSSLSSSLAMESINMGPQH